MEGQMWPESKPETFYGSNTGPPMGGPLCHSQIDYILNGPEESPHPDEMPLLLECSRNVIRLIPQLLADARQECDPIRDDLVDTAGISQLFDCIQESMVDDYVHLRRTTASLLANCSTCSNRHDCPPFNLAWLLAVEIDWITAGSPTAWHSPASQIGGANEI